MLQNIYDQMTDFYDSIEEEYAIVKWTKNST